MAGTPISITLYGEGDEIIKTYSRLFVPWKLLKAAVKLSKGLDAKRTERGGRGCAGRPGGRGFRNQFSIDDLNEHVET